MRKVEEEESKNPGPDLRGSNQGGLPGDSTKQNQNSMMFL
jgi:hypothetical protein